MLPVLQSPHNTSFYTKSTQPGDSLRESSYSSKIWFPLGGAWREQERGLDGEAGYVERIMSPWRLFLIWIDIGGGFGALCIVACLPSSLTRGAPDQH